MSLGGTGAATDTNTGLQPTFQSSNAEMVGAAPPIHDFIKNEYNDMNKTISVSPSQQVFIKNEYSGSSHPGSEASAMGGSITSPTQTCSNGAADIANSGSLLEQPNTLVLK